MSEVLPPLMSIEDIFNAWNTGGNTVYLYLGPGSCSLTVTNNGVRIEASGYAGTDENDSVLVATNKAHDNLLEKAGKRAPMPVLLTHQR